MGEKIRHREVLESKGVDGILIWEINVRKL